MRADGLVERDELAPHPPAGDSIRIDMLVQVDRDVDHGSVGALLCNRAAIIILWIWTLYGNGCPLARRCIGRWREQG